MESQEQVIERLEKLSDQIFIKIFRNLLDEREYNYPDKTLLSERYNAILILLADVPLVNYWKPLEK